MYETPTRGTVLFTGHATGYITDKIIMTTIPVIIPIEVTNIILDSGVILLTTRYLENCNALVLSMTVVDETYSEGCIQDALFHLKKANEALVASVSDPESWYNQSQAAAKILAKSLPFILAIQIAESLDSGGVSDPGENL